MRFDEMDRLMRVYETNRDHRVLPNLHMVVRLDGRNFTRLTKEIHPFKTPYDEAFRDLMLATLRHLMECGFRVIFGYTQSDEISLLLHQDDQTFERKERKLLSVLAGEASACFSLALGNCSAFDARISTLPGQEQVEDYFRWRMEDAARNCLNAHCYWLLRAQGLDRAAAHKQTEGLKVAERHDLLMQHGINFNDLPAWQKRGCGVYWKTEPKEGLDPRTGARTLTERRSLYVDLNLPMDVSGLMRSLQ